MTLSPTLPELDGPWDKSGTTRRRAGMRLVIAWSFDEPGRIGESANVIGESVLGRGGAQSDDQATRLVFHRRRPTEAEPGGSLSAARISRLQLRLTPSADGLSVRSVGRCTMLRNGQETAEAVFAPGDVLTLRNALVLYVAAAEPMPALRPPTPAPFAFGATDHYGIVGESPAAWRLRDELAFAARSPHHVLVLGESGSGKELAARALHAMSPRKDRPLVARNAATIPAGLADAELFGTARNYPNAGSPERVGLLGEADGSTLFLDEIGELPPDVQAHLLRVLDEDGEYQRLGESTPRRTDARVVAATNRDPSALKHDFLARFAARIEVPGLEARREDIPLLFRHVLDSLYEKMPDVRARFVDGGVEPALAEALLRHEYTHHLRELSRLAWLAVSTSTTGYIGLTPAVEAEIRLPTAVRTAEPGRDEIEAALASVSGSATKAAERLGLPNRFALYRLMKKHGIRD
jgi:DNA-binding NtrC family response regulator